MITGALETELVFVFQALCLESGYRCVLTLPAEAVPAQFPSPLQLFSTFTFPPQTVPRGVPVSPESPSGIPGPTLIH